MSAVAACCRCLLPLAVGDAVCRANGGRAFIFAPGGPITRARLSHLRCFGEKTTKRTLEEDERVANTMTSLDILRDYYGDFPRQTSVES